MADNRCCIMATSDSRYIHFMGKCIFLLAALTTMALIGCGRPGFNGMGGSSTLIAGGSDVPLDDTRTAVSEHRAATDLFRLSDPGMPDPDNDKPYQNPAEVE